MGAARGVLVPAINGDATDRGQHRRLARRHGISVLVPLSRSVAAAVVLCRQAV